MDKTRLAHLVYEVVRERSELLNSMRWRIESESGYSALVIEKGGRWGYRLSYPSNKSVTNEFIFVGSEDAAKKEAESEIAKLSNGSALFAWKNLK